MPLVSEIKQAASPYLRLEMRLSPGSIQLSLGFGGLGVDPILNGGDGFVEGASAALSSLVSVTPELSMSFWRRQACL